MRRTTVGTVFALLLLVPALSVYAQTPTGEPAPGTSADPAAPTGTATDPATADAASATDDYGTLPATATPWPGVGLTGALLLAAALVLRGAGRGHRARG